MFLFLQCIKGEAGASGIPGVDGREGHPVSRKHRHYSLHMFGCLSLLSYNFTCTPGNWGFEIYNNIDMLSYKDLNSAAKERKQFMHVLPSIMVPQPKRSWHEIIL